jgi:hypothetical protein
MGREGAWAPTLTHCSTAAATFRTRLSSDLRSPRLVGGRARRSGNFGPYNLSDSSVTRNQNYGSQKGRKVEMRKLFVTLTVATMMFFSGAILNRANAMMLDTSAGLRAAIEELDITELAHCRRYWHRHWHVGYGCGGGGVVVVPRRRVIVAPRPRVYVGPRRRW